MQRSKAQSQKNVSSAEASNEAILAAITKQGEEQLTSVSKLVDDLKKTMEGRLDSIDAHLATLQSKHHEVERRIDGMDEALTDADHRITALETTCKELQAANTRLSAKLNDLEGRSRRLNIRIVGIKEGEENSRPAEFVSELISKILGQENFSKPVKIDRAHRSLKPKPKEKEPPRVIIAKLHNDRDMWLNDMVSCLYLEELRYTLSNTQRRFCKIWGPFTDYIKRQQDESQVEV
ncbi:unnamed protein product [Leuciscus chuanchicus]